MLFALFILVDCHLAKALLDSGSTVRCHVLYVHIVQLWRYHAYNTLQLQPNIMQLWRYHA